MRSLCLVGSLALLCLTYSFAHAAEEAASTLPPRVARSMQGVTLTGEQQAPFQALHADFEARLADARKKFAAHELAKWRVGVIEGEWCERVNSLLTLKQKQSRLIRTLQEPTQIEFVDTPLRDVIDYLKDLHRRLPLRLDRAALRRANKDADFPITRNVHWITLDTPCA